MKCGENVVMDDPSRWTGVRTYLENGSPKSVITIAYRIRQSEERHQGTRKKKICRPHVVFLRASKIHPSIWHVKKKKLARPLFHNPYGRTEVMRVLRANLQGFRCWSGTNTALWSACGEKIAIFLIGGRNFRVHFISSRKRRIRAALAHERLRLCP